ncbi:flagellar motor protein [Alicyclobacillus tolerans]|uniref:flagellar motor protein n=1 Tax=Alicyclobacillus tolerans TaxID=90970 RepID=UPI001F17062A|nr:flagellar motor protein [Alicyclobacillus tolerans]MCF8568067.1 flagellar motor protein [Alicyclobacillus tolerans]
MDLATVIGVVGAIGSLIAAFVLDGGTVSALLQPTAALIVFGGTIGATLTTVTLRDFLGIGKYFKVAFIHKDLNIPSAIQQLYDISTIARREGLLGMEEKLNDINNVFLQKGLQSAIDGTDPELLKIMLETEVAYMEGRHEAVVRIFEAAGGFAPTMGIIGTVMGLVHVLANLTDVNALGPKIATAFIATLYGVSTANILWLPIGSKLKRRNDEEIIYYEMLTEGILSIQAGENPNILRQKLLTFLSPRMRTNAAQLDDAVAVNTAPV